MKLYRRQDDPHVVDQRNELRSDPLHHFVDRERFCNLLISSRKLERCDFSGARVKGLCDLQTGQLFMIEEEYLHTLGHAKT